jgi:transcriptional regulator with XRE-family HTH domain
MTNEQLGARLKLLRKKVKIEQEVIAAVLKIPRTAVSAFEAGSRDISAVELLLLCKVYRITPNEILGWDSRKPSKSANELNP